MFSTEALYSNHHIHSYPATSYIPRMKDIYTSLPSILGSNSHRGKSNLTDGQIFSYIRLNAPSGHLCTYATWHNYTQDITNPHFLEVPLSCCWAWSSWCCWFYWFLFNVVLRQDRMPLVQTLVQHFQHVTKWENVVISKHFKNHHDVVCTHLEQTLNTVFLGIQKEHNGPNM